VTPSLAVPLLVPVWDGQKGGVLVDLPTLPKIKEYIQAQLTTIREDHLRTLNPTPYKVSVSSSLYTFLHDIWQREVPIPELK